MSNNLSLIISRIFCEILEITVKLQIIELSSLKLLQYIYIKRKILNFFLLVKKTCYHSIKLFSKEYNLNQIRFLIYSYEKGLHSVVQFLWILKWWKNEMINYGSKEQTPNVPCDIKDHPLQIILKKKKYLHH